LYRVFEALAYATIILSFLVIMIKIITIIIVITGYIRFERQITLPTRKFPVCPLSNHEISHNLDEISRSL